MDLLIRKAGEGTWERTPAFMLGLERAIDVTVDPLVFCGDPEAELGDLRAAVRFFASGGGLPGRLAVASPCPSRKWIDPLRGDGVTRILVMKRPPPWPDRIAIDHALEVPERICSWLHVRRNGSGSMSVCGMKGDLAVLVEHHFTSRCFAEWESCPFMKDRG